MKIIYFDWFSAATEWYRLMPLDYVKSDKFTITRSTEKDINCATINDYDVVIISRPSNESSLRLIQLCKDQHKYVISDYDDDVLHVDYDNPLHGTYESQKQSSISCINKSNEVWVATNGLKNSFRLYNKNIHVIPNAWNDTVFPVKNKPQFNYNKICMWRGGHSHEGDIYEPPVTETIVDLINNNDSWAFYWLGQKFKFIEKRLKHRNYYWHEGASTVQFYKLMQEYNPCVFYYPLTTNVFNKSKSNCSFLESVYAGAAVFANKELPEFDKPFIGQFGADMLKTSKTELKRMHDQSWLYIQKTLLLSKVNELRKNRLEKI